MLGFSKMGNLLETNVIFLEILTFDSHFEESLGDLLEMLLVAPTTINI